ncbi:MAG: 16S rRNA (cytosine(1402)-N(4))-methyltransferase RsmH [Methylobacteriaceae bacterium]|nr:16S rRNA (cytosine(1402)-N(4))-methyltransferase RsmH [Methylobacteriaceae bacterium]
MPGARCGRESVDRGDRERAGRAAALLGRAGPALHGALRDERDPEDRRRGPHRAQRGREGACGHRRDGDLRGAWLQVPALGARELPGPARGRAGPHEGRAPGGTGAVIARRPRAEAAETALHQPVLLAEVVEALGAARGGVFLDGTFGAGGYTAAILKAHPDNRVVALDRDPDAIAGGAGAVAAAGGRLALIQGRFGALDRVCAELGAAPLDGVVLDIGVSSMQLDRPERGFSFRTDAPLDMRMEQDGPRAADLVNELPEAELADLIFQFGEERRSRVIARSIVERRRRGRIETTAELSELVARHVRAEPGHHPATRTFQALRIAVNDELGQLEAALDAAERALSPGGRLVVVTFHSLEDRIVKQFAQDRTRSGPRASRHLPAEPDAPEPTFAAVARGPVLPSPEEVAANPRARSAKLRVVERTAAPARIEAPRP